LPASLSPKAHQKPGRLLKSKGPNKLTAHKQILILDS
jgi:hypothetical protein